MRCIRDTWLIIAALGCLTLSVSPALGQRRQRPPAANAPQQPAAQAPSPTPAEPLRTASDRAIDTRDIKLDLRVDLENKTVESKAVIQFRCIRPTRIVTLDAVDFEVKHVSLMGADKAAAPAQHTYDGKHLLVDLRSLWTAGQTGTLQIDYRIVKPKSGLFFHGPSKTDPDVPLMVSSQGETITNRYWIPCIDEPDQRQTTEVVATVPKGFEAVSNGKLIDRRENPDDNTVTFDWRQEIPHPAYLVTLVVRQFDVVHEEWDGIPVDFYVPKGRKTEALPTYGRTRDMLSFFSERFGIHYPWAKYAQVSAYDYGGGMENTSATTMGDRILVDERTLLDRSAESIVSHELAHQWWGDMLTCRDWSHTWLNEGFASYAEALWDEHSRGTDEYAHNMFQKASGAIRDGKSRPIMDRHYPNPDSMFDGRAYPKGAWVLHMLRNKLGDEAFWKGIQRYGTEHKFQSVETVDFRRSMEQASGRDLERFFYDWLERPGNPDLEVATEYAADAQQVRIAVKQAQGGEPFHFPFKVVLHHSGSSEPLIVEEEMTEKETTLRIPLPGLLTRVDVDPDSAILTELKETKSHDLWRGQLLEAANVPGRLRAAKHFTQTKTDEDRELLAQAFRAEKFWAVRLELAKALGEAGGIVCRDALLQGLQHADARIRRACVDGLAKFKSEDAVVTAMKGLLQKGDPSYGVESAALLAYAKLGQKDAIVIITPWLSKPSHDDTLAAAALEALGATQDSAALETLLKWTEPGHPRNLRTAAQRALIPMTKSKQLTDAQRQQIVKLLVEALESNQGFGRFRILMALPDLGPLAASALPAIDKIVAEASEGFMRGRVKEIADKIRAQAKTEINPAASSSDVNQLRDEVKRLQREKEELRKRLEQYEKAGAGK